MRLAELALVLASCTLSSHDPSPGVDADTADAGTDASLYCIPTADECPPPLACRLTGSHAGYCTTPGPVPAGGHCDAIEDCGADLACVQLASGEDACALVCDTAAPHCGPGQACAPYWGETGACL